MRPAPGPPGAARRKGTPVSSPGGLSMRMQGSGETGDARVMRRSRPQTRRVCGHFWSETGPPPAGGGGAGATVAGAGGAWWFLLQMAVGPGRFGPRRPPAMDGGPLCGQSRKARTRPSGYGERSASRPWGGAGVRPSGSHTNGTWREPGGLGEWPIPGACGDRQRAVRPAALPLRPE